jgi:GH25 family lysozyme M1 (1,4-beta-N-acetylmuramidase)
MRAKKSIAVISALTFLALPITAAPSTATQQESLLAMSGPGNRIHGADISRWQHPGDKAIDFSKMRAAGLDFVMIKASDSREDSDRMAVKWVGGDRASA